MSMAMSMDTGASERVNILMVDDQPGKLLSYEAILATLGWCTTCSTTRRS